MDEICVDENLKIVTTPAYMYGDAKISDVFKGIENLVQKVIQFS